MRILQLDVNEVEYELVKPEAKVYEESNEKRVSVKNALLLLTSIEKGDNSEIVQRAVGAATDFAKKQKIDTLVIYPFAHLSSNLELPAAALETLKEMRKIAEGSGVKVVSSPFGWNKKLKVDIKGHPLAEMSRSYSNVTAPQKTQERRPVKIDFSIVKKSDWSGLPQEDHRTIGERLDLYSFQEVSPGMVYWHPNGHIVFRELMKYIREKIAEYGYKEIATPAFANIALWHLSGHWDHYKDDMYVFDTESQSMGLKPMNCPSTMLVFKSREWSYRDLPVRFADFDKLYRNEISGALTGLFRVREMTQDDAHLFVTEEQVGRELVSIIELVNEFYSRFGLKYEAKVATMPESHLGTTEFWNKAISSLESALEKNKVKYGIEDKGGAFYGPKIDFFVKDSMGREWQCATVQLDYQLPQRFQLKYTGQDGKDHMPVVIHRVIYGSLERFIGVLTEHCQGRFPTWLAPVQVRVMSISDQAGAYAEKVYGTLAKAGIRAELDNGNRTIDYKIRDAQLMKVPYMIVVGQKEMDAGKIAVRTRTGKQAFGIDPKAFAKAVKKEVDERTDALLYQK